jgi:uncharacterized protein (TIGR03435 family)
MEREGKMRMAPTRLSFTRKAVLSLAAAAIVPIAVRVLHAQSAETGKFDVASVRLHVPGSGGEPLSCSNGRLVAIGFPLVLVIKWAYDLDYDQLRDMQQRLPKWMFPEAVGASTLAYDIQAESEHRLTEPQCKAAMQALLADRFKLAVHWESKEAQVYDLVVARGGPKMRKASNTDTGIGFTITLNGTPVRSAAGVSVPTGESMQELTAFLSFIRDHQPVTDKTGLEGRYKFDLRFSNGPPGRDGAFSDPDLETALQQQLGLKLEARKGTVKTLLVDHIEQPSAN